MPKNSSRKSNGSGSIYFDKKKECWFAEIHWKNKNGEDCRKRFSGKKQTIVKNKLENFKRELLLTSGDIDKVDITFDEFANNWMITLKNSLKPSSYNRKEITLKYQVLPYLGNIAMNQINHNDIQNTVNSLATSNLSYSTIKKAYELVNQCFKSYRIKSGTFINPCEGVILPDNKKNNASNITFFDEVQRTKIIEESTRTYSNGKSIYRLGDSIVLLMYSGMRMGELIALTWDDINFDEGTININKNAVVAKNDDGNYKLINQKSTKTTSSNRIIPMTKMARLSLENLYKLNGDRTYVMSTKNNNQVTPRNINRMFHNILSKAEISDNCGVHTLRHTFASMLFKNGCSVKVVSEILGHSDTKITENIYIHLIQEQKVKAILDIDKYNS